MKKSSSDRLKKIVEELAHTNKWNEISLLVEEYHTIQQELNGEGRSGRPRISGGNGWGIRKTAEELKMSVGAVCQDLKLAARLKKDKSFARIQYRKLALEKL